MKRRLAAVALGAATLLVGIAPAAFAAEDIKSGAWAGSTLNADCGGDVCGYFVRGGPPRDIYVQYNYSLSPASSAPACKPPGTATLPGTTSVSFSVDLRCNGTYTVTGWAELKNPILIDFQPESGPISKQIVIDEPAPTVTGLVAAAAEDGSAVALTWNDMSALAPDLSGYSVERNLGAGYEPVTTLGASATQYVDSDLPDGDYTAQYRVTSSRPDKSGSVKSGAPVEAAAGYTAPTPTNPGGPTNPGDPNNPGGPGDPTTPTTGGGLDLDGLGNQPTVNPGRPSAPGGGGSRVNAPRLGITGTFLPPLLKPTSSTIRPSTPTTVDGGFEGELPYDVEPGEDDPVLPDDEMAAFFDGDNASRGMVIPIATALVLAVWAFHLRSLARMARPADGY